MKIGTLTYWWTQENYGQVLQCFALLRFLTQKGHEAFLIKYKPSTKSRPLIYWVKFYILYLLKPSHRHNAKMWKRLNRIEKEEARKHPRRFDDFRARYIPSYPGVYDEKQLKRKAPEADAYVCGSDQIWANLDSIFFLRFGSPQTRRVAYAPSFGSLNLTPKAKRRVKQYLCNFDFISSRERKGVQLLHELGYHKAMLQPDPTLLLPADTYREMEISPAKARPYLLLYLLGNETELSVEEIHDFARVHQLEVRYVASQGRIDQFPKVYPTVEEWLGLIDNADYVITNSFHGTVFCLQFNRPFLVFPVKGCMEGMNNRIYDLLNTYDLRQRIYNDSLDILFHAVDFSTFNKKRKEEQQATNDIFTSILKQTTTEEELTNEANG